MSQVFFSADTPFLGLIKSFAVFAVGYLARPLGGILFGWWGDRKGRKKAFVYSILLMSLSTLLMGLLPGYETIGNSAALLLLVFRIFQGASFGGELPGAAVFTAEHLQTRRGFATSFLIGAVCFGAAIGGALIGALTASLSKEEMLSFGWRIPFFNRRRDEPHLHFGDLPQEPDGACRALMSQRRKKGAISVVATTTRINAV